jgi:hypothetical protein
MIGSAPTKKDLLELLYSTQELAVMARVSTPAWRNSGHVRGGEAVIRRAAFQAQRELMHLHNEAQRDDVKLLLLSMAQALDTLPTRHTDVG